MSYSSPISADFLYERLEEVFQPQRVTDMFSKIGLQADNAAVFHKAYTATFASPDVIQTILDRGEQDVLLFTHHPVPPAPDLSAGYGVIPDGLLEQMREQRVSLFSYHIPMDAPGPYSTGGTLAEAMGCTSYGRWYPQNGAELGALCHSPCETAEELACRLEQAVGHAVKLYQNGGGALEGGRFAIMAGCAKNSGAYAALAEMGVRALVTGVAAPVVDWTRTNHVQAEAYGISIIAGTHYSTEKFAPMALCRFFRMYGLESEFLPESPDFQDL